jgi:putative copper resistance protein D
MAAPAPLTAALGVSSWRIDLPALVAVLVLGAAYLAGLRRAHRRGADWPRWRALVFLVLGLGSIVVATMSSLAVYDRVLFWPRAVQYTVLVAVAPLLLAVGQPVELARRGLGEAGRRRLNAVARARGVRLVSFPLIGALLGLVALVIAYFTPLYRLSLTSGLAHHLVMLGLLLVGTVFFVPELDYDSDLLPPWCGPSLRVVFAAVDGLVDALPGVVVMTMHGQIAQGYYTALHRSWGPSPKWDQTIGGGLMFTISELVALPFLVLLVIAWIRADEQQARDTDLRLEAEAAAAAASVPAAPADPDRPELGPATRPWWETEPGPLGPGRPT